MPKEEKINKNNTWGWGLMNGNKIFQLVSLPV